MFLTGEHILYFFFVLPNIAAVGFFGFFLRKALEGENENPIVGWGCVISLGLFTFIFTVSLILTLYFRG